ncbi:MAG: hypothetical protein QF449_03340 [Alphaproteobacteria bacterium]|jgi:GMP synthase-like glutamine amidotransferase|nr:hypothetical protein [Alphaproteobacteria bacterium]MDP6817062.1 hypothetical protein [Alphaproteobacteria bacterium]|tara:strand:+ start:722 stop:1447 length:726 start_codon:yes stop_codon:yes gene_type:complete
MKSVLVIQHMEAEYLGLIEDHLESRNIGFRYVRPFANQGWVPPRAEAEDALFLLGAGPWGVRSAPLLASLEQELKLTRYFLEGGRPVIGFGQGAQILALAAGGGVEARELHFRVTRARRAADAALGGFLPETFPQIIYMRDQPVPPTDAEVLAEDEEGNPALFQIAGNCLGFLGHPGIKSAMIEDCVMEFEDSPDNVAAGLAALRAVQHDVAAALSQIMIGLVRITGLMGAAASAPPEAPG